MIGKQAAELRVKSTQVKLQSKVIAHTNAELAVAQSVVAQVMAEGGTALDQYKIKHTDLALGKPIGEGAFGTVYAAKLRGEAVAVKTIRSTKISKHTVKSFRDEIVISKYNCNARSRCA